MKTEREKVIHHYCFFPLCPFNHLFCAFASPLNLGGRNEQKDTNYRTIKEEKVWWGSIITLSSSPLAAQGSKPTRFAYAVSRFPWRCDLPSCHPVLGKMKGADLRKDASSTELHKNSSFETPSSIEIGSGQPGVTMHKYTMFVHKVHQQLSFIADSLPAWDTFIVSGRFLRLQRTFRSYVGMYIVHWEVCIAVF